MKYFTLITHELALKNNLDKAAREFLEQYNRTIILDVDLDTFKNEVNLGIARLNAQFSRCLPLEPYWWQPGFSNLKQSDWILNRVGSCFFNLYATKN
jgi:hypothetical protein